MQRVKKDWPDGNNFPCPIGHLGEAFPSKKTDRQWAVNGFKVKRNSDGLLRDTRQSVVAKGFSTAALEGLTEVFAPYIQKPLLEHYCPLCTPQWLPFTSLTYLRLPQWWSGGGDVHGTAIWFEQPMARTMSASYLKATHGFKHVQAMEQEVPNYNHIGVQRDWQ